MTAVLLIQFFYCKPNARPELLLEAGARHERTLEAVSSRRLLGGIFCVDAWVRRKPPTAGPYLRRR